MWKDRQLPGKVIGITPSAISDNILLSTDLDVLDSSMLHCKGAEIASWLHENNMQEVPYVIIDDEYVILESQLPHFILTNPYDGLIEELAMRRLFATLSLAGLAMATFGATKSKAPRTS